MTNRKKRIKKGISSLEEQIELHKEKRKKAAEEGKLELANYYDAEIMGLEKTKNSKEDKLD